MHWAWVSLVAVAAIACSSSSAVDVVHDDAGTGGSAGSGGKSSGGSSGSAGTGGGGAGSGGSDAGSGGSAGAVATGPLGFEPSRLVLRGGESASAALTFAAEPGFSGNLDVTLGVTDASGQPSSAITIAPSSAVLSSSASRESLTVTAATGAPQGIVTVSATATPAGGGEPLHAELTVTVAGAPGTLDTTFDDDGYIDFQPDGNCTAEDVVALPDGRFVVTGQALTSNMMIARFNEDGTPDTTFGPDGSGVLIDPARNFIRTQPVLLPDGKLLVAFDNGAIAVVRVLVDGTLDTSWGTEGVLQTDLRASNNVAFAVDDDGRLLIGGVGIDPTTNETYAAVRRLGPDGALDTSFAGDGTAEINFSFLMVSSGATAYVEDLVLQSNGNIVAVGSVYMTEPGITPGYHQYAYRVQSNGTPDQSFGPQGVRLVKFGTDEFGNYEAAYSVGVQTQADNAGKTTMLGYYRQNADTPYTLSMVRFTTTGELDATFPGAGKSFADLPENTEDFPGRMLMQPDDGFITHIESFQAARFLVLRFTAQAALDPSWGSNGVATPLDGRAFGLAENGRWLLVVGSAQGGSGPSQSARIARYWLR